jgi:hypothetical protein
LTKFIYPVCIPVVVIGTNVAGGKLMILNILLGSREYVADTPAFFANV